MIRALGLTGGVTRQVTGADGCSALGTQLLYESRDLVFRTHNRHRLRAGAARHREIAPTTIDLGPVVGDSGGEWAPLSYDMQATPRYAPFTVRPESLYTRRC